MANPARPGASRLTELRDEYRRVESALRAHQSMSPSRVRALRISLRTFLDENRRVLPREESAALRTFIERLDHVIARL